MHKSNVILAIVVVAVVVKGIIFEKFWFSPPYAVMAGIGLVASLRAESNELNNLIGNRSVESLRRKLLATFQIPSKWFFSLTPKRPISSQRNSPSG